MTDSRAPFIYFDGVMSHGTLHGAIQVDLGARVIHTAEGEPPRATAEAVARLRCSPAAAEDLIRNLQAALDMFKTPAKPPGSVN